MTGIGEGRRPRIIMAVPQYPYPVVGGLERQAHELAKALARAGTTVSAISGSIVFRATPTEMVEGIPVHRLAWASSRWVRALKTTYDLVRTLAKVRGTFDVVHNHNVSWFGAFVILVAKVLRKPVLSKLPNVGEFGLPGMRARPVGWLCQWVFLRSDAVVAMSQESIQELAQVGYPPQRVFATPNGIVPGSDAEHGGNETLRIVFAGRLHDVKRIPDLIGSWDDVVDRARVPVVLEIWGDGPCNGDLRNAAARQRHGESIVFRGHVVDVRETLRGADIFVLPSGAEGNSNAILEAMDAGLPVVSTRVGGTAMLVGDEGAPYLYAVGDRPSLVDRLVTLVNHAEMRVETGLRMRGRIMRHFAMPQVAASYSAVYRLLDEGRRDEVAGQSNQAVLLSE